MKYLTLKDTIKGGKYNNYVVEDLVNVKGAIFSLIKEGYMFDDEVLELSHINRIIRGSHGECVIRDKVNTEPQKSLGKDTASIKQILAEINTIDKNNSKYDEEYNSYTVGNAIDNENGEDD